MNRWVDLYVYGQFRTAASVAAEIRTQGVRARVVERQGNYVVQVLEPPRRLKEGQA